MTQAFKIRVAATTTATRPSRASRPAGRGDAPQRGSRFTRPLVLLQVLLFVSSIAAIAVATNPSFNTVIQPGSEVSTASITIFTDGTTIFGKDKTGAIVASGTVFSTVVQTAINTLGGAGSVFFVKQVNPQPTNVVNDGGTNGGINMPYDYNITATINVPYGVSLVSNGAVFSVAGINKAAFLINPTATLASVYRLQRISDMSFLGVVSQANATAIYGLQQSFGFLYQNIFTYGVSYPINLVGSNFDGVIQGCFFNRGVTGVLATKGAYLNGANDLKVLGTSIQSFKTSGVDISNAGDAKVQSSYFENVSLAVTGADLVQGSSIVPASGQTGVTSALTIAGNSFTLSGTNSVGISIAPTSTGPTITGNYFSITGSGSVGMKTASGTARFLASGNTVFMTGSTQWFQGVATGAFTGNFIAGGNAAINLTFESDVNLIEGNYFSGSAIGVYLGGFYARITGNTFTGGTYDIWQSQGGNFVVMGNSFGGGVGKRIFIASGSTPTIHDNIGYVSENKGTVSLNTNTTYAIPHGLALTPTVFDVVSSNTACGALAISAIGAAYFTVTAASSCTATIYWYASISP